MAVTKAACLAIHHLHGKAPCCCTMFVPPHAAAAAVAAQVLSLLLEAAGFSLVHVMSGAAALAYLSSCELLPDLILLDVSDSSIKSIGSCSVQRTN